MAWKVRHALKLDYAKDGISRTGDDNIRQEDFMLRLMDRRNPVAIMLPETHPIRKVGGASVPATKPASNVE